MTGWNFVSMLEGELRALDWIDRHEHLIEARFSPDGLISGRARPFAPLAVIPLFDIERPKKKQRTIFEAFASSSASSS